MSMEEKDTSKTPETRRKMYIKWGIRLLVVGVLVGVIIAAALNGERVTSLFEDFLEWVRDNGFFGAIAFMCAYVIATVFFLPGLILTVGSGFVFGQAFGQGVGLLIASVVVLIGATIGASIAFLLSRTILREIVSNYAAKNVKFSAVDQAIGDEGFKMIFLLRLSPVIPFNAFNYFAGITSVKFRSYFAASLGMIPGTVVYCFVGTTIGELSGASSVGFTENPATLSLLIVGSVLAVLSIVFVSYKAKKAVNRAVAEAQNRRHEEQEGEVDSDALESGSSSGHRDSGSAGSSEEMLTPSAPTLTRD